MKSVLVVYGTTEGQTRKIAEFIAEALRKRGVKVELVDSASEAALKKRSKICFASGVKKSPRSGSGNVKVTMQ